MARVSIRWAQRAAELDPLSAGAWWRLGVSALAAGKLDLSRTAVARLVELGEMGKGDMPDYLHVQVLLAEGRPAEALAIAPTLRSGGFRGEALAMAHHALGHPRESEEAIAALIAEGASSSACQIANAYAYRGERDRAFEWLERAFAQRDTGLSFVKVAFRNLRDDPRYAALLRKMNLPLD
jgi:tetratricopeptide (TPR) repeat protein